jgi:hypothetical protein
MKHDLRESPSFASSPNGQLIIHNADKGNTGGTISFAWLKGVFSEYGVALTSREKNRGDHPPAQIVTVRTHSSEYRKLTVQTRKFWGGITTPRDEVVAVDNARKALQVLNLI